MAASRQRVIQTAEKLVRRGKLEAAISEYRKVLQEEPNDTRTLNRVGDLYLRLNRVEEGIDLFSRAAAHFSREGFFVKAIAIFKKIIRVDPTRIQIYEALADLYHRQGLINEARSQYQVVADYYSQAGDTASVISIYVRMIELEPDNPTHRVKLAELYLEAGRKPDAMEQYRRIAGLMVSHGRPDEATRVYVRALEIDASDLGFVTDAVLELKEKGHMVAAQRLLNAAKRLNPEAARIQGLADLGGAASAPVAVEPPPVAKVPPAKPATPPAKSAAPAEPPAAAPAKPPVEEPAVEPPAPAEPSTADEESFADLLAETEVPTLDLDEDEDVDLRSILDTERSPVPLQPVAPPSEAQEPGADSSPEAGVDAEEDAGVLPVDSLEFEIELDELHELDESAATPPPEEPEPAAPTELTSEAAELLSPLPPELDQPAEAIEELGERALELMAEAEVLAAYGLDDKAIERFEQILEIRPDHLEAHQRLIELHLSGDSTERVVQAAERAAAVAKQQSAPALWARICDLLTQEGYAVHGREVTPPGGAVEAESAAEPAATVASEASPAEIETKIEPKIEIDPEVVAEPEAEAELELDSEIDVAAELLELDPDLPPPAAATDAASADLDLDSELELDIDLEPALELDAEPPVETLELEPVLDTPDPEATVDTPESAAAAAEETLLDGEAEAEDGTSISWLEEIESDAASEKMFGAEEEFFDLAAELEEELREEEAKLGETLAPSMEEQTLEEIVEGFKAGVAATLAPEDYDTHYNLGIAYREMGLIDEAIGEFQLAAKDPRYLVDCCSLLGASFMEKGFGDLAVKWYRRGLASPEIAEDETLGLLYELGALYMALGKQDEARETYVEIYGINSNYRDVVAKLQELGEGH